MFGSINFDWSYFFGLFGSQYLYKAAATTLLLSVISWIVGNLLGFGLALAQRSGYKLLKIPSSLFVWVFRGTPLLVQIIIIYNAVPLIFPFTSSLLAVPFVAGAIALILNEAAFSSEIVRSGLLSVDKGQIEAGKALGMRPWQILRLITLRQAIRVIIPPAGNEFINVLKNSSMVSVISLTELTLAGQHLYTSNYKIIETLIAVSIYYLFLTTTFSILQMALERKLDQDRGRGNSKPMFRKFIQAVKGGGQA